MKFIDLIPVIDDLAYVKIFEGKVVKDTEFFESALEIGKQLFYNCNLKSMVCNKDYDYLLFRDVIFITLEDDYILILLSKKEEKNVDNKSK